MQKTEVLVIGAGPYGLSVAAYLRARGVDHVIVGTPMDTWRAHSPAGMFLKSEPYGSSFASARPGYNLATYSRAHGLQYSSRLGPLPLDQFLGYAGWFTANLVRGLRDDQVTSLTAAAEGFTATFAGGDSVAARQVVIATGVRPFRNIPHELSGLPADVVSHTIDHHRLDKFSGRQVVVLGAGQSALETSALLHEQGATVRIVARVPQLAWNDRNPDRISAAGHLRRPAPRLCEGWKCVFWNTPELFRLLPREMQAAKARSVLGPAGSWWLRDRVEGVIETLPGYRVKKADARQNGVRLFLDGERETVIDADHVVAGTGFRVDLARLPFLPDDLRSGISTFHDYPVLTRAGESSVPGLYFAGAAAAGSLGPSMRFVAGTHNIARVMADRLARRARAAR
jgi:cation diffusion facilitator CzcD-associated flavoprotein CzcO